MIIKVAVKMLVEVRLKYKTMKNDESKSLQIAKQFLGKEVEVVLIDHLGVNIQSMDLYMK